MLSARKFSVLLKASSAKALVQEMNPRPGDRVLIVDSSPELPRFIIDKFASSVRVACTASNQGLVELLREELKGVDVRIQSCSINAIPFADGSFDIVVSVGDLELVAQRQRFISEVSRLLKDGGFLFIGSFSPVGLLAWFRRLDWYCFDRSYRGKVDRLVIKKLFGGSGIKLLRSKFFRVIGGQELYLAKGVKPRHS